MTREEMGIPAAGERYMEAIIARGSARTGWEYKTAVADVERWRDVVRKLAQERAKR